MYECLGHNCQFLLPISSCCDQQHAMLTNVQAQLQKLQNEIAQVAKKTGIASAAKLATIQPKKVTVSTSVLLVLFEHCTA